MVAYFIRLATSIFGNSVLAIRLPGVILSTCVLAVIYCWSERHTIACWMLLVPLFLLGGALITPDLPLAFFWVLYVSWFMSANRTLSEWHDDPITRVYRNMPVPLARWALGGVILGLGLLSKYTMVLAIPCGFFVLVSKYRTKGYGLGYLVHLAVALLVASPILWFNWHHDFAPLLFQWHHATGGQGLSFKHLIEFVGIQTLLLSALPFLFLPAALLKSPELYREPRSHVTLFFYLGPMFFFLLKACRGPVEANWAMLAYLSFWPVAQRILEESSFRPLLNAIVGISFFPAIATSLVILVHLVHPLSYIPPAKDRVRKLTAQMDVAKAIAKDLAQGETLYSPNYQWTSYFRYLGVNAEQFLPEGRGSQFTLENPAPTCEKPAIIAFVDDIRLAHTLPCYPRRDILKSYPLEVRGTKLATFHLVRLSR